MNKPLLILIPILILLILGGIFYSLYKFSQPSVEIKEHKFQLIVAKTEKDLQIGLSKYNNIKDDQGMIFVFKKAGQYPFWMKDMKFPIDMIFISKDKIVTIHKNLTTNNLTIYSSTENADKVLEINANLSDRYGFRVGDSVTFKNLK